MKNLKELITESNNSAALNTIFDTIHTKGSMKIGKRNFNNLVKILDNQFERDPQAIKWYKDTIKKNSILELDYDDELLISIKYFSKKTNDNAMFFVYLDKNNIKVDASKHCYGASTHSWIIPNKTINNLINQAEKIIG